VTTQLERTWVSVTRYDQLLPERGVAALVDGEQVAVFRTFDGMLHAIGNRDPFSGAFVLSRGIVGSAGDVPTVASPIFKQVFDLRTGRCLGDPEVAVPVHDVRRVGDLVEIRLRGS
jgi:nitrite reductase (NADH) small subunit